MDLRVAWATERLKIGPRVGPSLVPRYPVVHHCDWPDPALLADRALATLRGAPRPPPSRAQTRLRRRTRALARGAMRPAGGGTATDARRERSHPLGTDSPDDHPQRIDDDDRDGNYCQEVLVHVGPLASFRLDPSTRVLAPGKGNPSARRSQVEGFLTARRGDPVQRRTAIP